MLRVIYIPEAQLPQRNSASDID